MKATGYAIGAVLFYAMVNLIIERKLSHISALGNMVFLYLGLTAMVVPLVLLQNQFGLTLTMPQKNHTWVILACALLFFAADFCYFSAYKSGGSLLMISTTVALFRVVASAMHAGLGYGMPSGRQIIGWVLAVVAVILVSQHERPPTP